MLGGLTLSLLLVALAILISAGKGSDSHESSAENSGEDEDYDTSETADKKTGAQHKFWIPTYQGTNPLNRRKIGITSSEIEKYDKSIDESISGVNKNRTRVSTKNNRAEGPLSMPIVWSGEDGNINSSRKYDISMDSSGITIEDSESSSSQSSETTSTDYSQKSKEEKLKSNTKRTKEEQSKMPIPKKKKYVEKALTSKFFKELGKATSNKTVYDADYYKKAVNAATENTKKKLGFNNQNIDTHTNNQQELKKNKKQEDKKKNKQIPEIIAVDIDSKSIETLPKEDEIEFKTSHKQHEKPNTLKSSSVNAKSNETQSSTEEHDSYAVYHTREGAARNETDDDDDSFTEFCDYSAWSDVLRRNKTERKGNQRKPKTKRISSTYLESRETGRPFAKKNKVEKLREKEGKTSRKKKRDREKRKKLSKIRKGEKSDDYEQEDYPEKKLRMRTKGEKQHAIKEVKGYLNEMDKKYGGRPGRDKYKSRGGEGARDGDRRRDDRRRNKWEDRGDDRDWGRDYDDRRRGNDRDGDWDRRERGMGRDRGDRRNYDDRRRDDYRGRDSFRDKGRDGYRDRNSGRGGYRDRDGGRGGYRDRDGGRGGYRDRDGGRGGYRDRDGGRGGYRDRDSGRGSYRGRGSGRGSFRGRGSGRGGGGRGRGSGRGRRDR